MTGAERHGGRYSQGQSGTHAAIYMYEYAPKRNTGSTEKYITLDAWKVFGQSNQHNNLINSAEIPRVYKVHLRELYGYSALSTCKQLRMSRDVGPINIHITNEEKTVKPHTAVPAASTRHLTTRI